MIASDEKTMRALGRVLRTWALIKFVPMRSILPLQALWVFGSKRTSATAEKLSIGNLKRTLVDHGLVTDRSDKLASEGLILLRHAVQVKNNWIPYGDQECR